VGYFHGALLTERPFFVVLPRGFFVDPPPAYASQAMLRPPPPWLRFAQKGEAGLGPSGGSPRDVRGSSFLELPTPARLTTHNRHRPLYAGDPISFFRNQDTL